MKTTLKSTLKAPWALDVHTDAPAERNGLRAERLRPDRRWKWPGKLPARPASALLFPTEIETEHGQTA